MAEIANVTVGKYRFVLHDDAQAPEAYRHGERWLPGESLLVASNSYRSLVLRVAELEASGQTSDEIASMAGRILAAGNPNQNEQVWNAVVAAVQAGRYDRAQAVLQPYFENMLSLAGSCLSQTESG